MHRAGVIGTGAMGTLCARLLAERGVRTVLYGRSPARVGELNTDRENRRYLPGAAFPDGLTVTSDPGECLRDAELIVSAVPCQYTRSVWRTLMDACPTFAAPVVSVTKGIEVDTLLRPTEILADVTAGATVVALSGPCLAGEVAAGLPAAVVVAGTDADAARLVQEALSTPTLRVYTHHDVIGVELGGAVKNVIAIAAGVCDGMKLGNNAKASLMTRGLAEIAALGQAMGAVPATFRGLAGIGDLITTCSSGLSRNHTAGEKIGRGMPVAEVVATSAGVIEGIETTRSVLQLAERHAVEMPITRAVHAVLFDHVAPRDAITDLMTRRLGAEFR
ncbi:MAG: NAD(P)-dependent glycerol-3-phosphate dehydrogenase [Phycisphaerales bacterium]|nr:NAD(P)-dependent glycerol-3-phosphate dehydrogenase [Phycisphaerales bacterium]